MVQQSLRLGRLLIPRRAARHAAPFRAPERALERRGQQHAICDRSRGRSHAAGWRRDPVGDNAAGAVGGEGGRHAPAILLRRCDAARFTGKPAAQASFFFFFFRYLLLPTVLSDALAGRRGPVLLLAIGAHSTVVKHGPSERRAEHRASPRACAAQRIRGSRRRIDCDRGRAADRGLCGRARLAARPAGQSHARVASAADSVRTGRRGRG